MVEDNRTNRTNRTETPPSVSRGMCHPDLTLAEAKMGEFLTSMGLDWKDDPNMADTPHRVVQAYYNDLWSGLYKEEPKITSFKNIDKYDGMVFNGNITIHSMCSHHLAPFIGRAYVAYIPSLTGKVIGLSKLNRIVYFYTQRPQIQENLTMQIWSHIDRVCEGNLGVAVHIEAQHMCCKTRGVKDNSMMKTSKLSGYFFHSSAARDEFYSFINNMKK